MSDNHHRHRSHLCVLNDLPRRHQPVAAVVALAADDRDPPGGRVLADGGADLSFAAGNALVYGDAAILQAAADRLSLPAPVPAAGQSLEVLAPTREENNCTMPT